MEVPNENPDIGKSEKEDPLKLQIGGTHYKLLKIQPVEYIVANKMEYCEANVVKYISRHQFKNGAEDIHKAIHYCNLILREKYGE